MVPNGDRRQCTKSRHSKRNALRPFRKRHQHVVTELVLRHDLHPVQWKSLGFQNAKRPLKRVQRPQGFYEAAAAVAAVVRLNLIRRHNLLTYVLTDRT